MTVPVQDVRDRSSCGLVGGESGDELGGGLVAEGLMRADIVIEPLIGAQVVAEDLIEIILSKLGLQGLFEFFNVSFISLALRVA